MYFYDELSVDGEMSYEECNGWFYKPCNAYDTCKIL